MLVSRVSSFSNPLRLSTPYRRGAILSFYRCAMHFIASNPFFFAAVGPPHRDIARRATRHKNACVPRPGGRRKSRSACTCFRQLCGALRAPMCLRAEMMPRLESKGENERVAGGRREGGLEIFGRAREPSFRRETGGTGVVLESIPRRFPESRPR